MGIARILEIAMSQLDRDPNSFENMSVGQHLVGAGGTLIIVFVVLPLVVWLAIELWSFISS
jgi:hypothetical protein